MNPEMQTTLLNTYPPKIDCDDSERQFENNSEHDQLNAVEEIAGPAPGKPS